MKRYGDQIIGLLAFLALLTFACATAPRFRRRAAAPPQVTTVYQRVNCMDPPPSVFMPEWPTPDRLGNFIVHESTAQAWKDGVYALKKYIAHQYAKCYVETTPPGDVNAWLHDQGAAP